MPRPSKRRRCMLQSQSETQAVVDAQLSEAEEEDTSSSSSTCSSSFPSSFPSSPSSPSSFCLLLSSSPEGEEEVFAAETQSPPQSLQRAGSPLTAAASTSWSQPNKGSSSQEEEKPSTSQDPQSLPGNEMDKKVDDLVNLLLLKYQMKEPITKEEMLNGVLRNYEDQFPAIFSEASECMQLVFGIDVKEVDPAGHSYVLVTTLGLTYNGMQSDDQTIPRTGLLLFVLSIIFMEGNCTPEKEIWEALRVIGVYAGREHFIFGEPRKLITEVWVQENYLEYRQVPDSDPACYELLWGPRAHAEARKMKVLEFLAKINGSDPRSFPLWYEEALRDEEERGQARNATVDDTTAMASASSSATSGFSFPK
ncbi:melanoma-associated antigen 10-like [Cynocephalus volans]|uniref:melanoma-associated antigen 10-like n=1 Tax=Cynocephalus volans TaxID=110931 RepID=UPI002FCAA24C